MADSPSYFSDPSDPRPGDTFHLAEGCIHSDGEVCWVEPSANACGKVGHVVFWHDERGNLCRTPWSTFQNSAYRVQRSSPPAAGPTPGRAG